VEQTSGTTSGAPPQAPHDSQPGGSEAPVAPEAKAAPEAHASPGATPGFGARGRARRRARFLRKARELAYRDLGGLVFNLHRFGQRNDELVLNKLNTLGQIDSELRTLEAALGERETVTVLHEAGITACPRCAAIHSGDDHFCPNCGLSMSRHVDLPIAGSAPPSAAPASTQDPPVGTQPGSAPTTAAATTPVPARAASSEPRGGKRDGSRAPTSGIGRSPSPPTQRTTASEAASPQAASEDGEQTQVLRPAEPEK
jgi:hypothetical protein